MTEVVSIRFKTCGKSYFFDPAGLKIKQGDRLVVETAKGLELVECSRANHMVEDTAVIPPLRPVVRIATSEDLRMDSLNRQREKDAFGICTEKITAHGLDMKLVAVECSFEGNKITFFFTADERVDFRELVKDLASVFHNRIELRQIGVRDEAKMVGGIGICGRPFCCSQFLDEFAPVSTKMAKVQSLSLNPAKISGCCGRLMCCLRYEEEAYEDLLKTVPKQGAFVETPDGYGSAAQIDLLRQRVKVKLDSEGEDSLHVYKAAEVAAVPGGRPKDGESPAHVLKLQDAEENEKSEEAEELETLPNFFAYETEIPDNGAENKFTAAEESPADGEEEHRHSRRNGRYGRNRNRRPHKSAESAPSEVSAKPSALIKSAPEAHAVPEKKESTEVKKKSGRRRRYYSSHKPKNTPQA